MTIFIKVLLGFLSLLYGTFGLVEEKPIKGFISVIFIAMLIAMEVLPC